MKKRRICKRLLASCALLLLFGFTRTGYAQDLTGLSQGKSILAYAVTKGDAAVYEDADLTCKREEVSSAKLYVTIRKKEGNALYCSYKSGGVKKTGWFAEKTFVAKPKSEATPVTSRHPAAAYCTKGGKKLGTIADYQALHLIGKSGSWYQVIYPSGKVYRLGWVPESSVGIGKNLLKYDASEKRTMATGVYTISSATDLNQMAAASKDQVTLKDKETEASRFVFTFQTDDSYTISSGDMYLTAEGGEVRLAAKSHEDDQIWQLFRRGSYYYVRNKASGKYLKAAATFTLSGRAAAGDAAKLRITMSGSNANWQVFSQYDPAWGGKLYGRTNTMAGAGCGILSSVNAVYALNGQFIDPMELAKFAVKKHYRVEGSGTKYQVVEGMAKHFGQKYGYKYVGSTISFAKLRKHLQEGGTAVAYVPGHYMAVGGIKNGLFLALDSFAVPKRKTTAFGDWVSASRFSSGTLKAKNFFLLKATK